MIKHCKIIFITSFRSYNLILLKLFSVGIYQNYFLLLIKVLQHNGTVLNCVIIDIMNCLLIS